MTTRKTYELPEPSATGYIHNVWFTRHSIVIDGDPDNDGVVTHDRSRGTIDIETHEEEALELGYDEAKRVALALLAAVEEAETMKEDN